MARPNFSNRTQDPAILHGGVGRRPPRCSFLRQKKHNTSSMCLGTCRWDAPHLKVGRGLGVSLGETSLHSPRVSVRVHHDPLDVYACTAVSACVLINAGCFAVCVDVCVCVCARRRASARLPSPLRPTWLRLVRRVGAEAGVRRCPSPPLRPPRSRTGWCAGSRRRPMLLSLPPECTASTVFGGFRK